jgi:beta-lactam-binding protein with PASTA domain
MDVATATAKVEASGFVAVIRRKASGQPAGTVIDVTPGVGEAAPLGSRIVLVVAI